MEVDEVHDMYGHILSACVSLIVKVGGDVAVWVITLYYSEMSLKPVHESLFPFSHVLYLANFACDAIYEIVALA